MFILASLKRSANLQRKKLLTKSGRSSCHSLLHQCTLHVALIDVLQIGVATAAARQIYLEAQFVHIAQLCDHLHNVLRRNDLLNACEK